MNLPFWIGVGFFGAVGALVRFFIDSLVSSRVDGDFPLGILAVNVGGAFLLGLLAGLAVSGDAWMLAATAILGSYTTFSTWMLDTHRLGERGEGVLLVTNIVGSTVLGLAAVFLGRALGGLF